MILSQRLQRRLPHRNGHMKQHFFSFVVSARQMSSFIALLLLYVTQKGIEIVVGSVRKKLGRRQGVQRQSQLGLRLSKIYTNMIAKLDPHREHSISRIEIMELAIRNMKAKKTRTLVTIGGMTIGIGTIVFLVSIGYGLQQLVVTRVARLEEMRQSDITPQPGGKVHIDDNTLAAIKELQHVQMTLPLIAVVGRVNYQNSVSDMAVYGVTTDYLKQSAIKPVQGKIFDSNEVAHVVFNQGQVAGTTTAANEAEVGDEIQHVDISLEPENWFRVRQSPSTSAKVLGYTRRVEGKLQGTEVWGDAYEAVQKKNGELGKWVKAPVLLWTKQTCDVATEPDCEPGGYVVLRGSDNAQLQKEGYIAELNLQISGTDATTPKVLGVTTAANNSSQLDFVEIASETGAIAAPTTREIALAPDAKHEAVVDRAMLKVLGINETDAVGKTFQVSFVVVGDLLADSSQNVQSIPTDYKIVGVVPEDKTPILYVPFVDVRSLGITNYSQIKMVVDTPAELSKTRRQVEAMGYITRSVSDTVAQINALFATARTVLALLGMVALSVAALGMFNTLTVSLLERTHEVGLMKAMGMRSSEVKELFLTESMIMGFYGGILGIVAGLLLGKLLGLVLSVFAIFKGVGFVDVSYIPLPFVFIIVMLSLVVGIMTGVYPARRATKISALNALRYE